MSEYFATVKWHRVGEDFLRGKYSRLHEWHFDNGTTIQASASPHIVPAPWSDGDRVDPEEAFVAAISSCHMLFFLSIAASKGVMVESYTDKASGVLSKLQNGKLAMTRVTLNPQVEITNTAQTTPELLASIHHSAHENCFIANSVTTDIVLNLS